jgi:hypothetical protein
MGWERRFREERRTDDGTAQPAPAPARTLSVATLLQLQRTAGNQATGALLSAAPRALIQREQLSDGTDTDTLSASDLETRWQAAQAGGNADDLRILTETLERLSNKHELDDDEEDVLERTIFAKKKMFKGVTYDTVRDTADWLARNPDARPPMPGGLFATVYGAATAHAPGVKRVPCNETAHSPASDVYFEDGGGERETDAAGAVLGAGRRPPVCHIVPYNHLMRAWLDLMTDGKYTGVKPGAAGYDAAHQELAWGDVTNLRPGHNHCNSTTAASAVGGNYPKSVETRVRAWAHGKGWI